VRRYCVYAPWVFVERNEGSVSASFGCRSDLDTRHDTRPLGRSGIHVLPLGIGTNKWRRADRGAVLETYRTIHDAGPCMVDTAEIYFSERVVGDCLRTPTRAVIASKFLPFPGRTSPRRLMSALDGSLARLGLKTIDIYYVHYPLPLIDVGVFAEGLVEAVKSGSGRHGKFQSGPDAPHRRSPRKGRRSARRQSGQLQPAPTSSGNQWRARSLP
jgi:aryl-alcohol dehydrogenase-like predicted oxidoreductase